MVLSVRHHYLSYDSHHQLLINNISDLTHFQTCAVQFTTKDSYMIVKCYVCFLWVIQSRSNSDRKKFDNGSIRNYSEQWLILCMYIDLSQLSNLQFTITSHYSCVVFNAYLYRLQKYLQQNLWYFLISYHSTAPLGAGSTHTKTHPLSKLN